MSRNIKANEHRPIEAVNKYKAIYEGYFNYFLG